MKKFFLFLLCCCLLTGMVSLSAAEPLTLIEDLTEEGQNALTDQAQFIYNYHLPQVDPADPSAELINTFYEDKMREISDFTVQIMKSYYEGEAISGDVTAEMTYTVACNTEKFFSVLIHKEEHFPGTAEYAETVSHAYEGHVFSRQDIKPGSSVALPYLLGILESEETDAWLQDRQTAKADALVRRMVWEAIEEMDDLELYEDVDEELLEYSFFPEEDFYLDENGEPVFYLQPGAVEDSERLITVPISIEDILDEM